MVCDEILDNEGNSDVGGNSEVESGVSYPKPYESLVFNSLSHCVEYVLIPGCAVCVGVHFL